ncbi:MAG: hypothetical protein LCH46_12765 [Proteobacteria bacterium]|nr:hypothetical protein [Pseudomonadota bacterium]
MKLGVLLAAALGLLALSGTVALTPPAEAIPDARAPAWVLTPAVASIPTIELTGAMGVEGSSGNVVFSLTSSGEAELKELLGRYASLGYVVTPLRRGLDNLMGSLDVNLAVDPMTGRSVTVTRVELASGSRLELSFKDTRSAL